MGVILGADGGNTKTELVAASLDGECLARVRGPGSNAHGLGADRCVDVVAELVARAGVATPADTGVFFLCGADVPSDIAELRAAVDRRGLARRAIVDNDTFAVLRASTGADDAVAVVCGAGINCVARAADGRVARYPSLGWETGGWGGSEMLGRAALFAAARGEDGRGPHTSLERAVPAHFGLETPAGLAEAIHRGEVPSRRLVELPPVVFAEAEHDAVAAEIVERLSSEIVAMARVALQRLDLVEEPAEVLLGGGLLQTGDGLLSAAVEEELRRLAPRATVTAPSSPPIVGAALLGLDALGAGADAQRRARDELEAAVEAERG